MVILKKHMLVLKKQKKIIAWKPKTNLKQGTSNFIKWYQMFYDKN